MAVTKTATKCALQLRVEVGVNGDGTTKYATRSLSVINPAVTDDNLFAFGAALGDLQTYPLYGINRVDTFSLVES